MLHVLDLLGTFVFAVSGAFRAVKYELDVFGVLVLAVATGVGGGIMADVLVGHHPPFVFRDESYFLACIAGGLLVFVGARRIAPWWDGVMTADAVGLAVFTALGASKGADAGLGHVGVLLVAAMTATGGGVVRDLLVREIPAVLRIDVYATASLAGAIVFELARWRGYSLNVQLLACIGVTLVLRLLAMRYKIALPRVHRLPRSPSAMKRT